MKVRLAAVSALVVLVACGGGGGGGSPTAQSCDNIAGTWHATIANSCGSNLNADGNVAQSGCNFSSSIQGVAVSGSISGHNANFTLTEPCGTVHGTATVTGNAVNGTFTGQSVGGTQCCPAGPVSGSFTLTR